MRISEIGTALFSLAAIAMGVAMAVFVFPIGLVVGGAMAWFGFTGLREVARASTYVSQKRLSLTNSGFSVGDANYSFGDVRHLTFTNVLTKKTTNFMASGEDQTVTLEIVLPEKTLKFVAGPTTGTFSFGDFGKTGSKNLIDKYEVIAARSFESRLLGYVNSINEHGYFVYDGMRFFRNGDVRHKDGTFNLVESSPKLRKEPFAIYVQGKRSLWSSSARGAISTTVDADVFFFLLDKLLGIRWSTSGRGGR